MNTDFRVIAEETFSYKEGKLYLMLINENNQFSIEVVDKKKTFGRQLTKDREQADLLYNQFIKSLSSYEGFVQAEEAVVECLKLKTVDKMVFFLLTKDTIITQKDIVNLKGKIIFKTRVKIEYHRNIKKENGLTVYVYLNSDKKAFGVLIGNREAQDLKFFKNN